MVDFRGFAVAVVSAFFFLGTVSGVNAEFDAGEDLDEPCRVIVDAMGAGPTSEYGGEWDWDSDGTWDDEVNDTYNTHFYPEGTSEVEITLKIVEESTGETDTSSKVIGLYDCREMNEAPEAVFDISSSSSTEIEVDASGSSDPNGDSLEYRWDWTDDGSYESDWSSSATESHAFSSGVSSPKVRLQVRDSHGKTDSSTQEIDLSNSGSIEGSRDPAEAPDTYTVDINGDGEVDSEDAQALFDDVMDGISYDSSFDYNCDDEVTVGDVNVLGEWIEEDYNLERCSSDGSGSSINFELHEGWNMVSLPAFSGISSVQIAEIRDDCDLLASSSGEYAYHYPGESGGYLQTSSLRASRGYWVETGSRCTASFSTGSMTSSNPDRELLEGWNMISPREETSFSSIRGDCRLDESYSTLYHWDGTSYQEKTSGENLDPKKGYWAKVDGECTLEPVESLPAPPS